MKNILLNLLFILLLTNCQNSVTPDNNLNEAILGTWVEKEYFTGVSILEKSDQLMDDRSGYIFNRDKTLIDRKNSGWCGTPPISYANFNGTWIKVSDDRLRIISEYWGGIDTLDIEIVSVSADELRLRCIY